MNILSKGVLIGQSVLILFLSFSSHGHAEQSEARRPSLLFTRNADGYAATLVTTGIIDKQNPFFQSLGSNGRSCASCHQQNQGWSITPAQVQKRFDATGGTDPIFRLNDGANSPLANVETLKARREAYSMLLAKGLIRVGIGIPDGAEFELVRVDDPYGYASAKELSLFRRPLPTANLKYLSTVMWDARETFRDAASRDCIVGTTKCFASLHFDLASQANSATLGHAQGSEALTPAQSDAILDFENSLFTAQIFDTGAGWLNARDAKGGPLHIAASDFYFGINDVLAGDYKSGAPFTPIVFDLFKSWHHAEDGESPLRAEREYRSAKEIRRAIARGEELFNTKPINISGVKGINDDLHIATLQGTCTTCHNTPVSGNHSIPMPLDIGLTDASRRTADLPLYTLRNKTTQEIAVTTDPGRALISGKWADIGRFKGPILRGLASRAPYFHNGSAKDLGAVVDFYNTRFGVGFTQQERSDLIDFLRAL